MRNGLRYLLTWVLFAGCHLVAQTPSVTPVAGDSWLVHLNRSFGDTSMGKTGRLGPGPQESGALTPPPQTPFYFSTEGVSLRGADLYRMNCQGCHGESGLGAPPEINSVINPVRATSVSLVLARMKNSGMDISYSDAAKLAQQSKAALLDRLHMGGEHMPPFPQLNEAEIRALLAYLQHLADVPGTAADSSLVRESHVRVGELIVKSTCHTCHSATGADPGPRETLEGAIPPLSALTSRKNQSEFIRKVTEGAPVLMGTPPQLYRGRMPVFFYLTREEAADVYLYLAQYPPTDQTATTSTVVASIGTPSPFGQGPRSPRTSLVNSVDREDPQTEERDGLQMAALVPMAGIVVLALAGGLVFTFREFNRLSIESAGRAVEAHSLRIKRDSPAFRELIDQAASPLRYGEVKPSSR